MRKNAHEWGTGMVGGPPVTLMMGEAPPSGKALVGKGALSHVSKIGRHGAPQRQCVNSNFQSWATRPDKTIYSLNLKMRGNWLLAISASKFMNKMWAEWKEARWRLWKRGAALWAAGRLA